MAISRAQLLKELLLELLVFPQAMQLHVVLLQIMQLHLELYQFSVDLLRVS